MSKVGVFVVVALCSFSGVSVAEEKAVTALPTLAELEFIAGCWEGNLGGGTTIRETFTSPRGGAMLGNSQVVAGGETQFFEFVHITEDKGGVFYHPSLNGQKAATGFKLAKGSSTRAVFENPEHDYPQRIVYHSPSAGLLVARVELMNGEKAQEFSMKAVPCGGEAHRSALN